MPREKPVASRRVKEFVDQRVSAYCTNKGRSSHQLVDIGAFMREN